jgi:radical SAM protein with 4Fe4S-binding SPASM domain
MTLQKVKFNTPIMVEYGLTPYCNAKCVFCLNQWRDKPIKFIEDWNNIKKICDAFIKADVFDVYLTGGEPTCSKYFHKTIKYLYDNNITISISTNGLDIDDLKFDTIKKYVSKIGVSIHNIGLKLDTIMSVKNSFKRIDKFIKKLDNTGMIYSLNYTIFDKNYDDLEKTLNYVAKNYKNISTFNINRMSFVGSAYNNKIYLSKKVQIELFKKIKKLNTKYSFDINLADVAPYCYTKIKQKPCGAGFSFTYIDPWGNNMLCIMNNKPFGNLLNSDLIKLWNTKELKDFRTLNWLPDKCKSCKFIKDCQGGCKFSQVEFRSNTPYSEDILLTDILDV